MFHNGCILIWFIVLQWIGLYLFFEGFLLTRSVIPNKAQPLSIDISDDFGVKNRNANAQYERAVIVVIDALRYDFLAFDNSSEHSDSDATSTEPSFYTVSKPYLNKLQVPDKLLEQSTGSEYAQLFKFIADAPTTTMQRLKGLTTGSLPTFIDAGSNFDSAVIEEDNWIDQMTAVGKKIVIMGDDTWGSLFNGKFLRTYLFDSFNVRDLHTVDNGCVKNLFPELKEKDWTVLISHFLGVDHCGHIFGPHHYEMSEKLNEMNSVLEQIVPQLDEHTVLFVLGDHGMTEKGDHGGDSDNEVNAGFFVYAKNAPSTMNAKLHWDKYLRLPDEEEMLFADRHIQQIDFVPTLSLLLGLPIPFGNLGRVIPEMFFIIPRDTKIPSIRELSSDCTEIVNIALRFQSVNDALRINAEQVDRYLFAYSQMSSEFHPEELDSLRMSLNSTQTQHAAAVETFYVSILKDRMENNEVFEQAEIVVESMRKVYISYSIYLQRVRTMTEKSWAKFDTVSMGCGLIVLLVACICMLVHIITAPIYPLATKSILLGATLGAVVGLIFHAMLADQFNSTNNIHQHEDTYTPHMLKPHTIALICVVVGGVGGHFYYIIRTWSVSFRSSSLTMPAYVAGMCVIMQAGCFFSNSFTVWEDQILLFLLVTLITAVTACGQIKRSRIGQWMGCLFLLRTAVIYRVCREEQFSNGCVQPDVPNFATLVSCYAIWVTLTVLHTDIWRYCTSGTKLTVAVSIANVAIYWYLVVTTGDQTSLPLWQQVIPPGLVYTCALSVWFTSARCLFSSSLASNVNDIASVGSCTTNEKKSAVERSAACLCFVLCLITEPRYVTGLLSMTACIWISIPLLFKDVFNKDVGNEDFKCMSSIKTSTDKFDHAIVCTKNDLSGENVMVAMVTWSIMGSYFFFATGHQASFPTIQWTSAFVGLTNMLYYPAIILVALNTFSALLLIVAMVPVAFMYVAYVRRSLIGHNSDEHMHTKSTQTSICDIMSNVTMTLHVSFLLNRGVLLLSAATAAALHRRHLMVWKIFAPRFLFEAASALICHSCLMVSLLVCFRLCLNLSPSHKSSS
eukprot:CFRG0440T1